MSSKNSAAPAKRPELPVAVDAMGGDHGPSVQVQGVLEAYKEFGARSILVGPEQELKQIIASLGGQNHGVEVVDAPEVITMEESPAKAVRRKPNSSLCVAYSLVQSGRASAILSSGNSGAMMAAGRFICGLLPGIERPAIATLIPVAGNGRPNVILDSGANVDCHAQNLVQFAVMGAIYYTSLFDEPQPKVALLSNGTESSKGTDIIRAASLILARLDWINYVGYVEGRDVTAERANVIACDGFVGNVLLKSMEGCVRLIYQQLRHEGSKGMLRRLGLGLSRGMLRDVFAHKFDYTAYGGAPLLGLRHLAVVLHGSSDSRAVKNAVRLAHSFSVSGMTERIRSALMQLDEGMPDIDSEILSGVFGKPSASPNGRRKKALESDDIAERDSEESAEG